MVLSIVSAAMLFPLKRNFTPQARPGISINNRNTLLLLCPTIMGNYVKLVFGSMKQIICRREMDFRFRNFFLHSNDIVPVNNNGHCHEILGPAQI